MVEGLREATDASAGAPLSVNSSFVLPEVRRPKGRPKQQKRLTTFNSNRKCDQKRSKTTVKSRNRNQKVGKPTVTRANRAAHPTGVTGGSAPQVLAPAANGNGGLLNLPNLARPATPISAQGADAIEVSPQKASNLTAISRHTTFVYDAVTFVPSGITSKMHSTRRNFLT